MDGTDPELAVTSAGIARGGVWREMVLQYPGGAGGVAPPPPPLDLAPPAPAAANVSARDDAAAERRLLWVLQCHRTARRRTGGRAAGAGGAEPRYLDTQPQHIAALAAGPRAFERSYYALKAKALLLHAALRPVWDECPQADTGFHAGPWVEDFWRANFARPVRREVLAVELELERTLIGEQRASLQRSHQQQGEELERDKAGALAGIVVESCSPASGAFQQEDAATGNGATNILATLLRDSVRGGGARPTAALEAARRAGAAWCVVEYALDYDLFFPLLPVFAPWERLSLFLLKTVPPLGAAPFSAEHERAQRLRAELVRAIERLALPTFAAFVTVAQRAQGVLLESGLRSQPLINADDEVVRRARAVIETRHVLPHFLAKTLVVNAGGGGDVAIPLLARELAAQPGGGAAGPGEAPPPPPLLLSFTGRVYSEAEDDLRTRVLTLARRHPVVGFRFEHFYNGPRPTNAAEDYTLQTAIAAGLPAPPAPAAAFPAPGADGRFEWEAIMARSAFQLAPSGTNPTSFRLYEALQLGHVPVFVFADNEEQPWLPFHDFGPAVADPRRWSAANDESGLRLWHRVGIVVPLSRFGELLDALGPLAANTTYMDGKRALVRAARDRFFTYDAVVRHLWRLFDDPATADLKCQQPPKTFF